MLSKEVCQSLFWLLGPGHQAGAMQQDVLLVLCIFRVWPAAVNQHVSRLEAWLPGTGSFTSSQAAAIQAEGTALL